MPKTIKWSSYADNDFAKLLEYLESKWNNKVCLDFIENLDSCIIQIQKNPELFPVFNNELQIRKCVVTKQILYFIAKLRLELRFCDCMIPVKTQMI
jgi:plasmid stabilization system protein ParE